MNNRLKNSNLRDFGLPAGFGPGSFLIAAPSLHQTPLERTVIFVLQHNSHGTFGVVVNHPADAVIKSAWHDLTGLDLGERHIVKGGPIGGPVFAIHQQKSLAEMEMPGGICVSADQDVFQKIVERPEFEYRIVFGVAGWQAGQLASEIEVGKWFHLDADPQHLFDEPDLMWENFLRQFGRDVLESMVPARFIPDSPWVN